MLVGNKILSAFEQCRGYQPSLCGLHRFFGTPESVAAHDEMVARRALSRACSKRNVNVLSCSELSPGAKNLFYFKDVVKKDVSRWLIGHTANAGDNFATIRRNRDGRGRGLKSLSRISSSCRRLLSCSDYLRLKILTRKNLTRFQGVSRCRSLQVLRRHPIFARAEALLAFEAVRTTKRTPLEMDIGVGVHGGLQTLDSVAEDNWVVIR
jgi:hypothetical protein